MGQVMSDDAADSGGPNIFAMELIQALERMGDIHKRIKKIEILNSSQCALLRVFDSSLLFPSLPTLSASSRVSYMQPSNTVAPILILPPSPAPSIYATYTRQLIASFFPLAHYLDFPLHENACSLVQRRLEG